MMQFVTFWTGLLLHFVYKPSVDLWRELKLLLYTGSTDRAAVTWPNADLHPPSTHDSTVKDTLCLTLCSTFVY